MRTFGPPALVAAALSFSVYLLPLVGPHTIMLLGAGLSQQLTGGSNREPAWIAADIGFALVLQSIAFGLWYWFLRNPRAVKGLVLIAAILVFVVVAQTAYLVAIPSLFLIENDTARETGDWPLLCSADGTMVPIQTPQSRSGADIPEALVQMPDGSYHLMQTTDCRLTALSLPKPTVQPGGLVDFTIGVSYFVPGRGVLIEKTEPRTPTISRSFVKSGTGETIPIEPVPNSPAVVSMDGEWIGWIPFDGDTGENPSRLFIRRLEGASPPVEIDLSPFGQRNSYSIVHLDVQNREIMISRNDYSKYVFMTLNFEGEVLSTIEPDGVSPQNQTFRKLPSGWVAWDAYEDRRPYRLQWSFPGGSSTHAVLRGRGITAVAANPSGTLIAVSVTTNLNIGSTPDSVYVLRAGDGSEAFRRYLSRYSRSDVLFPNDNLFMYSSDGRTYVLRVTS
jgi:hypothetical protein